MRTMKMLLVAAGLSLVAACGGQGDDATAERVEDDAEKTADAIETAADQADAVGQHAESDRMEDKAEAIREAGEKTAEAIDDADIKTDNPAAAALAVEGQRGLPTSDETMAEAAKIKE